MAVVTILIVDDWPLFYDALKTAFDREESVAVIGYSDNGMKSIQPFEELRPDIVLMDIDMKPNDGFAVTRNILKNHPEAKIIGLSIHTDIAYAKEMLRLGAKGYVPKTAPFKEIMNAIWTVSTGHIYFPSESDMEPGSV